MRSYTGKEIGQYLSERIENTIESVWVCTPWITENYASKLVDLSQKGIAVRVITSNDSKFKDSLTILNNGNNSNLSLLIIDETFIHSKMYIIDKKYAVTGSANLTTSAMKYNVETVNIFDAKEEVENVENQFRKLWMDYEKDGMKKEELSSSSSRYVKQSLPLNIDMESVGKKVFKNFYDSIPKEFVESGKKINLGRKKYEDLSKHFELIFRPYFFYEYIFRGHLDFPPRVFEDKGTVVIDAINRNIYDKSSPISSEMANCNPIDYSLDDHSEYKTQVLQPKIIQYSEPRTLAFDYIVKVNTRSIDDRVYIPRSNNISHIRDFFGYVPLWYVTLELFNTKVKGVVLGSSGNIWEIYFTCPDCNREIGIKYSELCENCRKMVCTYCIESIGTFSKKPVCKECKSKH